MAEALLLLQPRNKLLQGAELLLHRRGESELHEGPLQILPSSASDSSTRAEAAAQWQPRKIQLRGFAPYGCGPGEKLGKEAYKIKTMFSHVVKIRREGRCSENCQWMIKTTSALRRRKKRSVQKVKKVAKSNGSQAKKDVKKELGSNKRPAEKVAANKLMTLGVKMTRRDLSRRVKYFTWEYLAQTGPTEIGDLG